VQIALSDDSKRADRCQRAALCTVNLVDTVALPNGPALKSKRQVEISREHVAWIALVVPVAVARAATAPKVAVPGTATIAIVIARVVSVPQAA
jgi:hypothetical protein